MIQWTKPEQMALRRMRSQGMKLKAIAKVMGCTVEEVWGGLSTVEQMEALREEKERKAAEIKDKNLGGCKKALMKGTVAEYIRTHPDESDAKVAEMQRVPESTARMVRSAMKTFEAEEKKKAMKKERIFSSTEEQ